MYLLTSYVGILCLVGGCSLSYRGETLRPHSSLSYESKPLYESIRSADPTLPSDLILSSISISNSGTSSSPTTTLPLVKQSPTPFPWMLTLGLTTLVVGAIGMSQPHSCSGFTTDGRCRIYTPISPIWNILTLSGTPLSLIGWIDWKRTQDALP